MKKKELASMVETLAVAGKELSENLKDIAEKVAKVEQHLFAKSCPDLKDAEIIEQPKSILDGKVATEYQTEDGYDIYIGDVVSWAIKSFRDNKWYHSYDLKITPSHVMGEGHCLAERNIYRVFSTREAAEKWIAEQNKPKEIELDCGVVSKQGFVPKKDYTFFEVWEIKNIYNALEELNAIQQLKGGNNAQS